MPTLLFDVAIPAVLTVMIPKWIGLSWRGLFESAPDLALVAIMLIALSLATGAIKLLRRPALLDGETRRSESKKKDRPQDPAPVEGNVTRSQLVVMMLIALSLATGAIKLLRRPALLDGKQNRDQSVPTCRIGRILAQLRVSPSAGSSHSESTCERS